MICVNSVSVYPKSISLKVGTWSYAAYAEVCPSNADCKEVQWHSDNSSVASVNSSSGYIRANGVGTAHIYATATDGSGCSDYLTVTVSNTVPVTSVTLNRSSLSIEKGSVVSLSATVCPDNATNKNLNWTSSNNNVATVTNGVVTAVATGSTTITATAKDGSGKSASCTVTVTGDILVESIEIAPYEKTLKIGSSFYPNVIVCPTDATKKSVIWSSANSNIASVNPNSGLVYAHCAGTTTIYATAQDGSGVVGACNITVVSANLVSGVQITSRCAIRTDAKINAYLRDAEGSSLMLNVGEKAPFYDAVIVNGDTYSYNGETSNQWYQILYNGMVTYVPKLYCTTVQCQAYSPPTEPTARVDTGTSDLNLYSVAVRNLNKLIGDIQSETRVVVINPIRQNGLYYAIYGQDEQSGEMKYGWSSGLYFDFGDPLVTKSSNDCAEFIASYEALSRHRVPVENGNYAIGYGHTILPGEPYDADYVMDEDEALELLKSDLNIAERSISAKASNMGIRLHQHQFDALVSFAYNLGPNSQWIQVLIEEIMSGMDVHEAFAQYDKSGGKPLLGLYRRRMDEADIFVYGDYVREDRPDPNA